MLRRGFVQPCTYAYRTTQEGMARLYFADTLYAVFLHAVNISMGIAWIRKVAALAVVDPTTILVSRAQ
jgi:hypothetical protein